MSSRRKVPTDMAAVKKSRACYMGALTKANEKLKAIKHDEAASITLINIADVNRIVSSVQRTENGFHQNLEDAQDFCPEGDAEDTFQEEEEAATEAFETSIAGVRDQANVLIKLSSILAGIADLSCDISAVENHSQKTQGVTTPAHFTSSNQPSPNSDASGENQTSPKNIL